MQYVLAQNMHDYFAEYTMFLEGRSSEWKIQYMLAYLDRVLCEEN